MEISPDVLFEALISDITEADSWVSCLDRNVSPYLPGYSTPPEAGSRRAAVVRQLNSFLSKFRPESSSTLDDEALRKFLDCNNKCGRDNPIDKESLSELTALALSELQCELYSFCFRGSEPLLSYREISDNLNIGPGASVGASGTSFYNKLFAGDITASSSSLIDLFNEVVRHDSLWFSADVSRLGAYKSRVVLGSKLSFVAKDMRKSRTICTEPLVNMLFQKGISACIERGLAERYGIYLDVQPQRNAALAWVGSRTGKFATIDLSSASDTISHELIRHLFPASFSSWLTLTRSPVTTLPNGDVIPLHMVSSMGNGFTFSLETLLFTAVVIACYRALGIEPCKHRENRGGIRRANFGVFGDDLVVDVRSYNLIIDVLRRLGFSANREKSFSDGFFRESCGSDYWFGDYITPVYAKSFDSPQDRCSLINRLNIWSATHEIPLCRTIAILWGRGLPLIPPRDNEDSGVWVPRCLADVTRKDKHLQNLLYRGFVSAMPSLRISDVTVRPSGEFHRGLYSNPSGFLISALAGHLRDGMLRNRLSGRLRTPYKMRWRSVPCWDWAPRQHAITMRAGWRRWIVFVELNLDSLARRLR